MSYFISSVLGACARTRSGKIKAFRLGPAEGLLVRIPKRLRKRAEDFARGEIVRIWLDPRAKRPTVAYFLAGPPKKRSIAVCCHKHCCRRGSNELLLALQEKLAGQNVEVKACGCLKDCRNGPNLKLAGRVYSVGLNSSSSHSVQQFIERNLS